MLLGQSLSGQPSSALLENRALRAEIDAAAGRIMLLDRKTGVSWAFGPAEVRSGDGRVVPLRPSGSVQRGRNEVRCIA